MIVSRNTTFLEKLFIQNGGSRRLIELDENVSEERQAIDPQKSINDEPLVNVSLLSRRSGRIFHPLERYMGILKENIKKAFLVGDGGYGDDFSTFDEMMSNIDFEKWLDTIKSEIDLIHLNQIWSLVDPSEKIIFIECK